MNKMNRLLTTFFLLITVYSTYGQNIFGKWKTIDDNSGKAKSILNIYQEGEKVYAKVIKILEKGRVHPLYLACSPGSSATVAV